MTSEPCRRNKPEIVARRNCNASEAKIAERYRRGKLFCARAGEITTWKTPYGYRRITRSAASGPAHLEIYEPEAAVVRRIFTERVGHDDP